MPTGYTAPVADGTSTDFVLAEHDTTHELNEYASSGGSLDDHRTVAGYCPTCDLHIVRVHWVSGRIDDSLMSTEQRRILAARRESRR